MRALVAAVLLAGTAAADDTEALQKSIDAGGVLRLPKGTYRISRPLVIDLDRTGPAGVRGDGDATIVMSAAGPAILLRGTHLTGTAAPDTLSDSVRQRERSPLLDGFAITASHAGADGIRVEGTMQATLTRLTIQGVRNAVYLTGRSRNVIISDCHLYNNSGAGVLMEKLSLHQVNIANSHISYNRAGGVVVRDSEIRNLQIGTCDIEANMGATGPPAANLLFDTRGGSIREGAITGCTLQHSGGAPDSANIRFIGAGPKARNKVGFFSIADNTLSDVQTNIHLKWARGVSISGNAFAVGLRHNLLVEESSDIVVGPNVMDQNPDYDREGAGNAVVFLDSADCSVHGLHINRSRAPEAALVVRRGRRFHITAVTILDSDGDGILLDEVESSRVSGCLVNDGRQGSRRGIPVRLKSGRDNRVAR